MTNIKDQALDLALEALRSAAAELYIASSYCNTYEVLDNTNDAVTAIKKARALDKKAENARELGLDYEPHKGLSEHVAQATNGRVRIDPVTGDVGIGTPPAAQPAVQEPVAILKGIDEYGPVVDWYRHWVTVPIGTKFYTTPPAAQRQWVGLTDEEIKKLRDSFATRYAIKAIEAKLKEKNNG